jgi:hypothetical protein
MSANLPFCFEAEDEYQGKPQLEFFNRFLAEGDSEIFPIEVESSQSISSPISSPQIKPNPEENIFTISEEPSSSHPMPITLANGKIRKSEGCRCSKTGCLKDYCSCLRNKVKCGPKCGCRQCQNNSFVKACICNLEDFWMVSSDYNKKNVIVL